MALRYEDIAGMIDHSLLHPTLTDDQLLEGCETALLYRTASVCIKPYALPIAVSILKGSPVKVGTVVSFPHGNCDTKVKVDEARQAIADGAQEIDMVINTGKALGGNWDFIEYEVNSVLELTRDHGVVLKIIFENDFLGEEEIIELCKICSDLQVPYVKTSTGYGFVKQPNGYYGYKGATLMDLEIMKEFVKAPTKIKAAGGIRTLDDLLLMRKVGVSRVGATSTVSILNEFRKRKKAGLL